jgi:nitrogen-specific signal transduction histidine kinase
MKQGREMRRKVLLGIFVLIFGYISFVYATEQYPWTLKPIYEREAQNFTVDDFEGDGVDEIIEGIDCFTYIRDQCGIILGQFTARKNDLVCPLGFFKLKDGLSANLFVSILRGDTLFLRNVYEQKQVIVAIGKDISQAGHPGYDAIIWNATASDIDGDGYNEIVCLVNTGFDLWPRGIFVYDYKENKELWHYWIGCNPYPWNDFFCVDINNDNRKEIFFGTIRSSNGGLENGVDDFHPWVIALSPDGRPLWQKELNEDAFWADVFVGIIDTTNKYKVVVCEIEGNTQSDYINQLFILNPGNGTVERYIQTGKNFLGMRVCDFNRDGKLEIVTGNYDGKLRIFDCNLELLKEKDFGTPVSIFYINDLDGDGRKEIILAEQDGRLLILNEKLQVICSFKSPYGNIVNCFLARNKKEYRIITGIKKSPNFIFTVYQIVKTPFMIKPKIGVSSAIIIIILGFVIIFLIHKYNFYRQRVRKFLDEIPSGILILSHSKEITYYNYSIRKIIGETKGDLIKFIETPEMKKLIEECIDKKEVEINYNEKLLNVYIVKVASETLVIVTDRSAEMTAKNIISWSGFAQRLAHEIKNPLSTINLTLQRMYQLCKEKFGKKADIIDGYVGSVLEEVERLRKTTDRFMRVLSIETPKFTMVDINGLLDEILKKYESTLPQEIKINRYFDRELPLVRCDKGQIVTAFSNIIENAIEAMEGNGVFSVRTAVIEAIDTEDTQNQIDKNGALIHRYVEVRFEDTGKGFSEEQQQNIFKPFYSTKKNGTGLGLVITKRIIEGHNGKIDISSKMGIGTVVTITLPL